MAIPLLAKVAIAAVAATYLSPPLVNAVTVPELDASDAVRNDLTGSAIQGAMTAAAFALISRFLG